MEQGFYVHCNENYKSTFPRQYDEKPASSGLLWKCQQATQLPRGGYGTLFTTYTNRSVTVIAQSAYGIVECL